MSMRWLRRIWYVDFVTNSELRTQLRALPALPKVDRMTTPPSIARHAITTTSRTIDEWKQRWCA
jgi:hypothetical protein